MRAIGLMKTGGPEVLEILDLPEVNADDHEVRVKVMRLPSIQLIFCPMVDILRDRRILNHPCTRDGYCWNY